MRCFWDTKKNKYANTIYQIFQSHACRQRLAGGVVGGVGSSLTEEEELDRLALRGFYIFHHNPFGVQVRG